MSEKREKNSTREGGLGLTKEGVLSLKPIIREVYLTEIGESLWVKTMSVVEHRRFRQIMAEDKNLDSDGAQISLVSTLVALCTVRYDLTPVFTLEDRGAIDDLPSVIVMKVFSAAADLNGLTKEALEEKVKN